MKFFYIATLKPNEISYLHTHILDSKSIEFQIPNEKNVIVWFWYGTFEHVYVCKDTQLNIYIYLEIFLDIQWKGNT